MADSEPDQIKNPESAFYLTQWAAALPLVLMIAPVVALGFEGVLATTVLVASGIVGVMLGSFLSRRKKEYWEVVTRSLADPTGLIVFALFLMVGIYGKLLTAAHLTEGIVWLSQQLALGPALFTLFVYVSCAILGTAMGTSVGIVVIMTPILYPAAIGLGIHPMLAAGAILSGAATGDHLAPVSDTTIISSMTQRYRNKSGSADIGGVVRARLIYVIPAFLISCALYMLVGGLADGPQIGNLAVETTTASSRGLVMLIPMLVVIVVAVSRRTIFEALTYGIVSGILIALGMGLIGIHDLFYLENNNVKGLLVEGAAQNLETIVMIVMLMGAYGVMRSYGILDRVVNSIKGVFGDTPRDTELTMFGIGWILNFLLIGLVTRLTVIAGPIFNELGGRQHIHPYRRANILDAIANSFSYVIPWHVWPILMIAQIKPLVDANSLIIAPAPSDFLLATYYPVAIWAVMLLSIITGFGRKFEGPAGEVLRRHPGVGSNLKQRLE